MSIIVMFTVLLIILILLMLLMVLRYNLVASLVLFEVNGTSASEPSVVAEGFIQLGLEDIDHTTQRRNLTATAIQ